MLGLDALIPLFAILVMSLSFHEAAHAWTADRLGDPTARALGRLTLNPLAHIDWIGTVLFPILAIYSGLPLIGWAIAVQNPAGAMAVTVRTSPAWASRNAIRPPSE